MNRTLLRALFVSIALCIVLFSSVHYANESNDSEQEHDVNLGIELTASQLEELPIHVFSDGAGLPDGSGTAAEGSLIYVEQCAICHGSVGQGGKAVELVGDASLLATDYPDKGIAVYWPFAPTLYEYISRSMPPATPGMFSADELYSLIAHLLQLNDLIEADVVLDKQSLSGLKLPNRDGFNTIAR